MRSGSGNPNSPPAENALPAVVLLVFAAAAGLSVANIYYAQPLLDAIAADFDIAPAVIGGVVMLTQVGYGLGLIFIVPLGDLIDRRTLIIVQGVLSTIALVAIAMARTEAMLFVGMAAVGCLAVLVQVLVAFAATLAAPAEHGKAIGTVTSGIVIGILAARSVAGLLADLGGWRSVYAVSAVLIFAMTCVLARILPRGLAPDSHDSYAVAVRSIPRLFANDRIALVRGILAMLSFASFSTLWTSLVLPLSAEPYGYSHTQIGLFGLVGMAGALAASSAGRLADRGFDRWITGSSLALLFASWALIALLPRSIPALVVGIVVLDLAVQAIHVTNQSILVSRHPEARSRLIGGYMLFYSVGSAPGAITSTLAFAAAGWTGVAMLGAGFALAGLLVWLVTLQPGRRNAPAG
ncbi:MAG: MFS transporter [Rhodopseudomonas palustris]|uniref:MFS transporter n=1 Tax=Rhodopseudomonas palustris TaxID=1076 RepID=A0A933VWJ3_RHOPL|nr:MFS transporter [Rhodopseudomonas palustris]